MAERSKALDWNSSKPRKGFRGFESHSLRHIESTEVLQSIRNSPIPQAQREWDNARRARLYDSRLQPRVVATRFKYLTRINARRAAPKGRGAPAPSNPTLSAQARAVSRLSE